MLRRVVGRRIVAVCSLATAALLVAPPAVQAASGATVASGAGGRYIVQFDDGGSAAARAQKLRSADVVVTNVYSHVFDGAAVTASAAGLADLEHDPHVTRIAPDVPVHADLGIVPAPDASADGTQVGPPWHLDRADQHDLPLSHAYGYTSTGKGLTAYVIDSGIRTDHTQFGGRARTGVDEIGDGYQDCDGHGTYVAGLIGGATYGVAKEVNLVSVRVLDCNGEGYSSDIIAGIDWVVATHPDGAPAVANMSLGGAAFGFEDAAVQAMIDDGVTVTVSAGNDGVPACNQSPARLPAAITVAASSSVDGRPSWSNYGSCVDLFAPGVAVESSYNTSSSAAAVGDGTSAAAPQVAGAAALLLAVHPSWKPSQVAFQLAAQATPNKISNAGSGTPNRLLYLDPPISLVESRAYVKAAYSDFLGRLPSNAELDISATSFSNRQLSRSDLVTGLASSAEWVSAIVQGLYVDTLGRAGDAGGAAYWSNLIRNGSLTVAQVAASFYASPEYFAGFGASSNGTWVRDLYTKVLGRTGDESGVAYWVSRTVAVGRVSVAYAFFQSSESAHTRVKNLYQKLLGRAPDGFGWDYWSSRVIDAGDISLAAALAVSDEYYGRAVARFG